MATTQDALEARISETREVAGFLAQRVRGRSSTPIRRGFAAREAGETHTPPMASILRSGRGAGVRLKLYLALLWVAVGEPHDVTFPARTWAALIGLSDPEGVGARQVRSGLAWLYEHDLIDLYENPGQPSTVTLLDETGAGNDYVLPAQAMNQAKQRGEEPDPADRYFRLPLGYWTQGWVARLSGTATAMLLVLLEAQRPGQTDREIWFSPAIADARYVLSENTRSAGLKELREAELVVVHRRPVDPRALTYKRVRNTYTILMANLDRHFVDSGRYDESDT